MTQRTDHAAKAEVLLSGRAQFNDPDTAEISVDLAGLTHATLALVEQQRIANLIAIHRHEVEHDLNGDRSLLFEDGSEDLRPEVAAALGLEGAQS